MRLHRLALTLLVVIAMLMTGVAASAEFRVEQLSARPVEGTYLMDANIDYQFSDTVIEALHNGVPLTLEVHVQLREKGSWIWENDLLDLRLRYRIRYLVLSSTYQVEDLQSDVQQTFFTQRSAFEALGEIKDFPLIAEDRLSPGESYRLSLRASLDIEALPLPLRPTAYLTSSWKLSSKWREWPLQR
ncbi:MAG: DUF4390 domain-containing protein [Gammaproteobacteria bacterium]|nr:DUF4390 domain-containing protein [Gammaproteobacteria bacterium]